MKKRRLKHEYICIDATYSKVYLEDVFKNKLSELEINAKEVDERIFVAYVTEEQVNLLEKSINEAEELEGFGIIIDCVAENFVEELNARK